MKATFESGTLDNLLEYNAKPIHDGIVTFFNDILAIANKANLASATLYYFMQQALTTNRVKFLALLDRLYGKTHNLSLIGALKMLHDLSNDNLVQYHSSSQVNALTFCSRIDTTKTEKNKLAFLKQGIQPLLTKLINNNFTHIANVEELRNAELQAVLACPYDFSWRLQSWLHKDTNVHLNLPNLCFDGIDLDRQMRDALFCYHKGEFDKAITTIKSANYESTASYNHRMKQVLWLASLIMQRKISSIPATILETQNPAILGALLNLPCGQSRYESAWQVLTMCKDGKQLMQDLLRNFPALINLINPALIWNQDSKTHLSCFYWLCTELEIEDITDEVDDVLRKHPPFGLFTGLTAKGLSIPKSQLCGLTANARPGARVLVQLLGNSAAIAKLANATALTTPLASTDTTILNGTTALQMLCTTEAGLNALFMLLQANPELINTLHPALSVKYQRSDVKSNATAEAHKTIDLAFAHETAGSALCATSRGREVLNFIFCHCDHAVQSAKYAIPLRQMVEDIQQNTDDISEAVKHYQNAIKISAILNEASIDADIATDEILLIAQQHLGSNHETEFSILQKFAHQTQEKLCK